MNNSSLFISNTISFSQFTHIESGFFQYQKSTTENPIRITCQKINPIPHRTLETHHETHLYIVKLANLLRQTFLHNPHEHRRLPVNCHKVLHQVIIHNYCICWLYVFICFTALCFFSKTKQQHKSIISSLDLSLWLSMAILTHRPHFVLYEGTTTAIAFVQQHPTIHRASDSV